VVKDVYSDILEKHLGWPAYVDREMIADYQDSAFSAGVMSFGAVGFVVVPLALIWGLYLVSRGLERSFHGLAYGVSLLSLWLVAMRIEVEWSTIPLNLRQAAAMGIVAWVILWASRLFYGALRVASRPPHPIMGTVDSGPTPV
jgi:FlaA1/EpsC-like NDP-sugar epimerase